MIIHEYRIEYKPGDVFTLKPLFDIHYGNKYCDKGAFTRYLADSDEKTYYLGGGDMLDSIITKDIKRYSKDSDGTLSDAIIDEQIDEMEGLLKPYQDRIIGLGTGNHESVINKYHGTNPIRRLAKRLNTISLGFSWMVTLRFSCEGGRGRTLKIRGHHGWGGGARTRGANITKYSHDMNYWDADLFLYGHVHAKQSDQIDRMSVVGKRVIAKPKHLFICGTYLKTFSLTDEAPYSEEKGYPPTKIGGINIKIKPDQNWLKINDDT